MKLIRGGALFVGLLGVAGATQAGVTSTWALTNDYDFRGFTQTAGDPAIQASLDYSHDSGWYAGAWASNIKFSPAPPLSDPKVELDLYGGFKKTLESGLSYDLGGVYYSYPEESDYDYGELYAGLGYTDKAGWSVAGKFFYSPDFGGKVTSGNTPAEYITGDVSFPLPQNFSITAHAGYSFGDYWDNVEYFDWAAGVGYAYDKLSFTLKWIDGSDYDLNKNTPHDFFETKGRVVFAVSTTFPWGEK